MTCLWCKKETGTREFCGVRCIEGWQAKYGHPEGRPWSQEQ